MKFFYDIFHVFRREMRLVFTDVGVMLFFFALPLAYPIVYTLIYNPEVVTEIPTVIVDGSRSAESRELERAIDATPGIHVIGYASDMAEARRAMARKDAYGIIEVPADYARKIGRGEPATMSFYADMSLLIRYRQYLFALTDVRMDQTMKITAERLQTGGLLTTTVTGMPVDQKAFFMGDTSQGFASFVMPGIVILILQQSLLLGICMIAGTACDRRRRDPAGRDPLDYGTGTVATVLGKALCHIAIYLPMAYYVMAVIPHLFKMPEEAMFIESMPMIFVMLLATSFLGQTLQIFARERESSLLVIVFTSVVFLFLSGLTWPRYAFSPFWKMASDLVPATWGVESFIRMNGNGSSLADVSDFYLPLWILAGVYFITALLMRRATHPRKIRNKELTVENNTSPDNS